MKLSSKLKKLSSFLEESGNHELSHQVSLLNTYKIHSKVAFLGQETESLQNDINQKLIPWNKLLLSTYSESEIIKELDQTDEVLEGIISELNSLKAKFKTEPTKSQKEEIISSFASDSRFVNDFKYHQNIEPQYFKRSEGGKFWSRAIPLFGLAFSLKYAAENVVKAYYESRAILDKLPLSKYNLSAVKLFSPAIPLIGGILRKEIEKNRDNPENLYEILEICKVLSKFYVHVLLSFTNVTMLITDIAAVIASLLDGPSPVMGVIANSIGLMGNLGVMGLEIGAENFSEEYWRSFIDSIRDISIENIEQIEASQPT